MNLYSVVSGNRVLKGKGNVNKREGILEAGLKLDFLVGHLQIFLAVIEEGNTGLNFN